MQLTKTDIKRTIQSEMAERGAGRGWKKFYTLRRGDGERLRPAENVDTAAEAVSPGQIIDVEAAIMQAHTVVEQRWVEFQVGEDKIWARENEIRKEHLDDGHLIFER